MIEIFSKIGKVVKDFFGGAPKEPQMSPPQEVPLPPYHNVYSNLVHVPTRQNESKENAPTTNRKLDDSYSIHSKVSRRPFQQPMGFNRVLDGLKKKQLQHDFQLERAAETYEPVQNIGSGAFGIVCEAVETSSQEKVAIKKVAHASATPTLARRTLREIRVLRYINHPNIVTLRDIFRTKGPLGIDVYLVMDLMENNLHQIIYGNVHPLEEDMMVHLLNQLLKGLDYLHAADIAHRDLKPSNLLVNSADSSLRIADFGMAKCATASKKHDEEDDNCFYMTQHVATLPYRAPELLFVMPTHDTAVDMWAVGCIFAEMIMRDMLFAGRSVQEQIKLLLIVFGRPPQNIIENIRCDRTKKLIEDYGRRVPIEWEELLYSAQREDKQIIKGHCDAIDFVKRLFYYDASERMNVKEAIQHPYIESFYKKECEQAKCPFRIKRDMVQVEKFDHESLIKTLCDDVRSAESYTSFNSAEYTIWRPRIFQRERDDVIRNFSNGRDDDIRYGKGYDSRNILSTNNNRFDRKYELGSVREY